MTYVSLHWKNQCHPLTSQLERIVMYKPFHKLKVQLETSSPWMPRVASQWLPLLLHPSQSGKLHLTKRLQSRRAWVESITVQILRNALILCPDAKFRRILRHEGKIVRNDTELSGYICCKSGEGLSREETVVVDQEIENWAVSRQLLSPSQSYHYLKFLK